MNNISINTCFVKPLKGCGKSLARETSNQRQTTGCCIMTIRLATFNSQFLSFWPEKAFLSFHNHPVLLSWVLVTFFLFPKLKIYPIRTIEIILKTFHRLVAPGHTCFELPVLLHETGKPNEVVRIKSYTDFVMSRLVTIVVVALGPISL